MSKKMFRKYFIYVIISAYIIFPFQTQASEGYEYMFAMPAGLILWIITVGIFYAVFKSIGKKNGEFESVNQNANGKIWIWMLAVNAIAFIYFSNVGSTMITYWVHPYFQFSDIFPSLEDLSYKIIIFIVGIFQRLSLFSMIIILFVKMIRKKIVIFDLCIVKSILTASFASLIVSVFFGLPSMILYSVNACNYVYGDGIRDACFYKLAVKKDDIKYCKKIIGVSGPILRECSKMAEKKNDISFCDDLTKRKGKYANFAGYTAIDCYAGISGKNNSVDFCNKLKSKTEVGNCYLQAGKNSKNINNISWCEKGGEMVSLSGGSDIYNVVSCYEGVATNSNNVGPCEAIEKIEKNPLNDSGHFDDYLDPCYMKISKNTADKTLCQKIRRDYRKKDCLNGNYELIK